MKQLQYSAIEHLSFLSVIGPDSKKFLQGQSSCQFNNFEIGQQKLGSFSDAKGRVYGTFNAIAIEDGFLLQMSKDIIEHCLTHLKKYAAFFKVTLSDEQRNFHGIGLQGDVIQCRFLPNFDQCNVVKNAKGVWIKQNDQQIQCWINPLNDQYDSIFETIESDATYQTDIWLDQSIEAGIAWLSFENIGEFVAQMLNLDLIDAVDFKKGCYTGQEIIARLHYKGKSKKRMHRVAVPERVTAGTIIVNSENKAIGKVVNSSSTQALISATNNEQFFFEDKLENSLELLDLPYEVSE
ncbi:YgfZ/GcvT domain-containing protein [Marinicellulosiphila megalodicopiae]|uniref:CAF17-like 4Fe-4S cluster assembly/insertion protein YgfZ n=1 Tax=Marinicellulosiphila megalodicopiae TaxID=2724896 RepID=UPI003BAF6739